MALRRGYGHTTIKNENLLGGIPWTFFLGKGEECVITLLDDLPVEVVVHVQYVKGDKKANGMRATCAGLDPAQYPEPVPKMCKGCNAMFTLNRIARKHFLYLSLINETLQHGKDGKAYKDMKRLLELSPDQADTLERRRKTEGTLVGAQYKVYRGKGNTPRHGNDWQFQGFVDAQHPNDPITLRLKRHFWQSPAIPHIRESAKTRDKLVLDHDGAVERLITPFDYEDIFGKYDVKKMEAFIMYHEAAIGRAPGSTSSGTGYVAPPMPGEGPNYSMPTSNAPAAPPPPPPPAAAPAAPASEPATQTPPPPPPAAPVAPTAPAAQGPPSVPDPVQAGGPAYEAPPFPTATAPPAPPAPAGQTPAAPQPPQPSSMPGAGYNFGPPNDAPGSAPQQPSEPFGVA